MDEIPIEFKCLTCGWPLTHAFCPRCLLRQSDGHLSDGQWDVVRQHVAGKVVNDLGAGNLGKALKLLELGARRVLALDPTFPMHAVRSQELKIVSGRFSSMWASLAKIPKEMILWPDVTFLSWPPLCDRAEANYLSDLIGMSDVLIYAGKNTDGVACGHALLFRRMLRRRLITYLPEERTTLLVLGEMLPHGAPDRRATGEERAAQTHDMSYAEALDWDMAEGFVPREAVPDE